MDGPKIVENLFFGVTCVSVFTCTIRSDYNFAMGLLCYYMIKNASNKIGSVAQTLLVLNALTIVMDVLWCITMQSVWSGKPLKNASSWKGFDYIRSVTLFLSAVNIVLKCVAAVFLVPIWRGAKKAAKV